MEMNTTHVDGENKGKIILYALSTCGWCKKTKKFLNELGLAYDYIDVDKLEGQEKDDVKECIREWNPKCSYPTLVINDKDCVAGFRGDDIRKALGI